MKAVNFKNILEIKELNIPHLEQKLQDKVEILLDNLRTDIEGHIKSSGWKINNRKTQIKIDNPKKDRGRLFIENSSKNYEIGMEHFNPLFNEGEKRADNIFCGKFNTKWENIQNISDFNGNEMKSNSTDYVNLLLQDDITALSKHFFEEFKIFFDKYK